MEIKKKRHGGLDAVVGIGRCYKKKNVYSVLDAGKSPDHHNLKEHIGCSCVPHHHARDQRRERFCT